jgi:hypothetical protein
MSALILSALLLAQAGAPLQPRGAQMFDDAAASSGPEDDPDARLLKRALLWDGGQVLRIGYDLVIPLREDAEPGYAHALRLQYTWGWKRLRLGLGARYGSHDSSTQLVEGYATAGFQLSHLGGTPLTLAGLFNLVPYAAVDLGAGYHGFQVGTRDRGDFGNAFQSYALVRANAGVLFIANGTLAVIAEGSFGFTGSLPASLSLAVAIHL